MTLMFELEAYMAHPELNVKVDLSTVMFELETKIAAPDDEFENSNSLSLIVTDDDVTYKHAPFP